MRFFMVFFILWFTLVILTPAIFSDTEVPELELDVIVAGVKYNDSLLKTGKGHFIVRRAPTEEANQLLLSSGQRFQTGDTQLTVAFDGVKVRCETVADIIEIFDGEKQVEIYLSKKYAGVKAGKMSVGIRGKLMIAPRHNPRYWGLYVWGKPLGEYLEEKAIQVVGNERINGLLCYVVQAKLRRVGTIKFWIAPEQGFRALKSQYETSMRGFPQIVSMETVYQELKDGIFFPKSAINTTFILDKKTRKQKTLLFKYFLTVEKIEVNGDVSDQFQFNIPPDTIVWDYRSSSERTAAEAGISTNKR